MTPTAGDPETIRAMTPRAVPPPDGKRFFICGHLHSEACEHGNHGNSGIHGNNSSKMVRWGSGVAGEDDGGLRGYCSRRIPTPGFISNSKVFWNYCFTM